MPYTNYFQDGYTESGFIAAVPRMHGALRFTYRPALVEERSQLSEAAAVLKAHLYDRHAATFTAGKIVLWDLTDTAGRAVAISSESLLRLHPELFVKLHRIVVGWIASDTDPAWRQDTYDRVAEDEIDAALSRRSVGEVREESSAKN